MRTVNYLLLALLCLIGSLQAAPYNIGVIPKSTATKFWDEVQKGAKAAGEELDANIVWSGPRQENQSQAGYIKRMIKSELINAIVIAPSHHSKLQRVLLEVVNRNIKLVVIDSNINNVNYDSFIATDNYLAGTKAADFMAKFLGENANIAVIRFRKGNASTEARENGFINTIKNTAKVNIVFEDYLGPSTGSVYHEVIKLLNLRHDIDGFFTPSEATTEGLLRAFYKMDANKIPVIIGFDSNDFLEEGLRKNMLKGLVVQQPFQMGYLGVKTAIRLLNGEKVKKNIFLPIKIITASDLIQREQNLNSQ
ncbi:substrate-binding domain-containing protein [Zooshikella harenae]|uniref:Substrate-binding domain-containing protein n=1 Tax=Zooshikella harenae TaxID=2827238 RepID=A0ABS5Z9I0_9GAMM|nr:substrate-binding domain-containing protein [Zooshikella harenae]MBU2709542.1 substrate-binding domain-containing protein [Zooshikella harenae]